MSVTTTLDSGVVSYSRDAHGVVSLTWNLPNRPVNVLTMESMTAFADAVERVLADPKAVGAVVCSAKRDFIVGLDLNEFATGDIMLLSSAVAPFHRMTRRIETGGKPFVAALGGNALGGGAEIALACHYRLGASDVPGARFGCPEVSVGLIPGGGGTQRIPRLAGVVAGLTLMLEGKRLKFADAVKHNLIDALVPSASLMEAASAWVLANREAKARWDAKGFRIPGGSPAEPKIADSIAVVTATVRKKTWGNFPAARAILSSVYEGTIVDIDGGLKIEEAYFKKTLATPEAHAMVKTLFFSLNAAKAVGGPSVSLSRVGVIGAGMMGAGIAAVAAKAGLSVKLVDRDAATAMRGRDRAVAIDPSVSDRIVSAGDYASFSDVDLVIEAVFEDRLVKADVTRAALAVASSSTVVFGSNTSTLPIDGLADASSRPENFIGIHFFSPVERMPLVEIIRGVRTSDAALGVAISFVRLIGKTPIVVNDARGFFTSRVFSAYVMEGLAMLREGVAPALIENCGRIAGMAVGPLAVADEVSFSLLAHVRAQTRADLGDAFAPGIADDVIELFAATLDRPGKAAGRGIYEYPADGKKFLWPGLREALGSCAPPAIDTQTVCDRLMYAQVAEASRALSEGVLTDPAMGDVGSILGWGFPAFTGGVFSYPTFVGIEDYTQRASELARLYGERFLPAAIW